MSVGTVDRRVIRGRVLRSRGGGFSLRVDVRTVVVSMLLLAATLAVATLTLTTGDYHVAFADVLKTLAGRGAPADDFIVTTLRLPRLLTGLFVGAALAVSGALLQSLTRNPLGSPDIIGLTGGSVTGGLLVIIVAHGSMAEIALGSLVSGLITAAAIYALAFRRGVQGLRLILVGIGVSAALWSVNDFLITRANLQDAVAAKVWLTGSLNGRQWEHVWAVGLAIAVLIPVACHYGRRLALLGMGDDAAKALGVPVERSRLVLILVSVALAAIATSAAGPISFVALAAPQVARKLTRSAGAALLPSALTGALLLVTSDLVTQRAFAPHQLPVGIATGAIGGVYLAWLLAHEWRRGRP